MQLYPYTVPIILNDEVFTEYGGKVLESTPQLRNACYLIAEQQVSSYLGTFLLPTHLTGSVDFNPSYQQVISTDYGYVSELLWLRVVDSTGNELYKLDSSASFGAIREDTYGYVFVENIRQYCGQGCGTTQPFKFQYTYVAGLPTGTATQPAILTALSQAAQLILNELQEVPANESTGDIGVLEYSSLRYSEKRKGWKNTIFGSSPKSVWIAKLLDGTIKKARKSMMVGRF